VRSFVYSSAGCVDEPTGFDPGPDGGSRSDTPDGEGDAGAQCRSPEGVACGAGHQSHWL